MHICEICNIMLSKASNPIYIYVCIYSIYIYIYKIYLYIYFVKVHKSQDDCYIIWCFLMCMFIELRTNMHCEKQNANKHVCEQTTANKHLSHCCYLSHCAGPRAPSGQRAGRGRSALQR